MQALELIKRAESLTNGPVALARELGIPQQHVSDWKAERRTCPPDMRARLAAIAGLDPVAEAMEGLAEGLSEQRREGLRRALQSAGGMLLKFYPMQHAAPAPTHRGFFVTGLSRLMQEVVKSWPGCNPDAAPSRAG